MKVNKCFLLFLNIIFLFISLESVYSGEGIKKYYLITKIGKADFSIDRLRFYSEDKLLLLDKKKSLLSYWGIGEKNFRVIEGIFKPLDFDYASGSIYLLHGDPSLLKRYFISPNTDTGNEQNHNAPLRIDSVFNLNQTFNKPVSISVEKFNRYIVVADTGSIKSINYENKMFALKFLNYRPGDVVFDASTRAVYSSEFTTKSLIKISIDGKLEPLISNFDCNNQFVLGQSGNLFILDIKNNFLAKFGNDKKLNILMENISGAQSITIHRDCDTIIYLADKKNEIFRIEEIPWANSALENIISIKKNNKVFISNSIFIITDGKSKKYYYSDGKKCITDEKLKKSLDQSLDSLINISKISESGKRDYKKSNSRTDVSYFSFIGNASWLVKEKSGTKDILSLVLKSDSGYKKHEIAVGEFISNPSITDSDECLIIDNTGKLVKIKFTGEQEIITGGLSGYKKILYSNDEFCFILNEKGELLKINYTYGKMMIMKNVSNKSEIVRTSTNELFLKDETKIYKLETGMQTLLQFLGKEKPAFCYHRGYSAKAPENSMSAFDLTLSTGGKFIEFDVQMTKDNELVVMHDGTVNRTSNGKGKIVELNMNQIDTIDIGLSFSADFKGERIPKFNDVLSRFKNKLFLDIELKGSGVSDIDLFCEKVISGIKKYNSIDQILITSFNRKLLEKVRKYNGNILTGLLIDNKDQMKDMDVFMDENKIDAIVCNHHMLDKELVASLKAKNKMVMVYTVNNKKDFERCKELGADCIITNDPLSLTSK